MHYAAPVSLADWLTNICASKVDGACIFPDTFTWLLNTIHWWCDNLTWGKINLCDNEVASTFEKWHEKWKSCTKSLSDKTQDPSSFYFAHPASNIWKHLKQRVHRKSGKWLALLKKEVWLSTRVSAVTNLIRCNSGVYRKTLSDLWATALQNLHIYAGMS